MAIHPTCYQYHITVFDLVISDIVNPRLSILVGSLDKLNERLDLLKNNYEILMRYWKLNKLWKQTFDMCALSLGTLAEWRPYSTRKMLFCNFRTLLCLLDGSPTCRFSMFVFMFILGSIFMPWRLGKFQILTSWQGGSFIFKLTSEFSWYYHYCELEYTVWLPRHNKSKYC